MLSIASVERAPDLCGRHLTILSTCDFCRSKKFERDLQTTRWKVDFEEITFTARAHSQASRVRIGLLLCFSARCILLHGQSSSIYTCERVTQQAQMFLLQPNVMA